MASTDDQLRLQGVKEGWVGALDQELSKEPTYQDKVSMVWIRLDDSGCPKH
jgi:hypothetical protein